MAARQKRLQCGISSTLDSSRWIKLTRGLTDFRFGPPATSRGRIIPASPAMVQESLNTPLHSVSSATASGKSSQSSIKQIPERIKQKEHVKIIEKKIKEDPLILFPYLESHIPHEISEKLVSILGLEQDSESTEPLKAGTYNEDKLKFVQDETFSNSRNDLTQVETTIAQSVDEASGDVVNGNEPETDELSFCFTGEFKKKNVGKTVDSIASLVGLQRPATLDPYHSFLKRINYSGKTSSKKTNVKPINLDESACETDVRQVAEDFCKWMQSIGGEDSELTMAVDEVLASFAMEDLQTPDEVLEEPKKLKPTVVTKTKLLSSTSKVNSKNVKKSKFVRCRYGAWYLDINQWKKLKPDEALEDPKGKQASALSSYELDVQLGELHIYNALTSFIERNNLKTPNFLMHVAPSSENVDDLRKQEGTIKDKEHDFHQNCIGFDAYR